MFSGLTNFINNLQTDPVGTLVTLLYTSVCILISLILHECAHGYVALKCGDPTAKWMGRLTLNPAKHLDPIGTICMVFLHIGWAKPVPINPRNFRNPKRDYILVSLAGIAINLILCFISLLLSSILAKIVWEPEYIDSISSVIGKNTFINPYLGINALKGSTSVTYSTVFSYPGYFMYAGEINLFSSFCNTGYLWLLYVQRLFLTLAMINLGLAVFNLLPVPPLDGYRFMDAFVFKGRLSMNRQTMQIISIVFMFVIFSGLLDGLLTTVNSAVMGAFSSAVSWII